MEEEGVVIRGAKVLDARTSRRGFLARTAAFLGAVGVGSLSQASTAEATTDGLLCCTGAECAACSGQPSRCASGYTYTGYTWTCCSSGSVRYCTDCRRNGSTCTCQSGSQLKCNAGTLTDLMPSILARTTK